MGEFQFYLRSALVLTLTSACAPSWRSPGENAQVGVISSDEIARSASTNAWDLLRNRARQYEFTEDQYGRPRAVRTRRGRSTINVASADVPLIIVDGARITDLSVLRDMPAASIQSVELLSGIGGTASQGTNAAAGVIYIHTWEASQN
jgi:hypothetical protein